MSHRQACEAIVEALPASKQSVASAINDVSRELGGAIGIAVLGSALTAGYVAIRTPKMPADILDAEGEVDAGLVAA